MKLRPGRRRLRLALKRFIYSQLSIRDGFLIDVGSDEAARLKF
jgi:hypothetical protein